MPSQAFRFKQFTVQHHRATMPVGTDAVLLGAWAFHASPQTILDVGTGCGVIALMLAQRFERAAITAIDLDATSVEEANENFENSPFANRLTAKQADFRAFQAATKFDLIVSNPPYFNTKIKPTAENRSLARNTETLPYPALLKQTANLLHQNGCFCCVLPVLAIKEFVFEAELCGLKLNDLLYIKYNTGADASVALLSFSFIDKALQIGTLVLYDDTKTPTAAYTALVKDFYLWG